MESHIQGTWYMMKSNKHIYTLFHKSNATDYDYIKEFNIMSRPSNPTD